MAALVVRAHGSRWTSFVAWAGLSLLGCYDKGDAPSTKETPVFVDGGAALVADGGRVDGASADASPAPRFDGRGADTESRADAGATAGEAVERQTFDLGRLEYAVVALRTLKMVNQTTGPLGPLAVTPLPSTSELSLSTSMAEGRCPGAIVPPGGSCELPFFIRMSWPPGSRTETITVTSGGRIVGEYLIKFELVPVTGAPRTLGDSCGPAVGACQSGNCRTPQGGSVGYCSALCRSSAACGTRSVCSPTTDGWGICRPLCLNDAQCFDAPGIGCRQAATVEGSTRSVCSIL